MDDNDQPAAPEEGAHAAKAKRTRRKASKTQVADDQSTPADVTNPPPGDATGEDTSLKLPDPRGRGRIYLGDGRTLRLLRSNQYQQAQIAFLAPEGEDAKPDVKYTRWLRAHGWQWRGPEKVWTKQFAKNTEDDRYARSNSDLAAEREFAELGNLIRQDKGMEPVMQMEEPAAARGS
jgi:hypothetical protein